MNAKIMGRVAISIYVGFFILGVVLPSVWVYARVSTCGWKGLFVECRIQECAR